jgi:hypothetical protein
MMQAQDTLILLLSIFNDLTLFPTLLVYWKGTKRQMLNHQRVSGNVFVVAQSRSHAHGFHSSLLCEGEYPLL